MSKAPQYVATFKSPIFLQIYVRTVLANSNQYISSDPPNLNNSASISRNRIKKHKMMNFLALGLVLTSLVTAGFFSPNPPNPKPREDVIVKEGHRVVVVEYEKDHGNTKVLISPQDSDQTVDEKGFVSNAKESLSEKMEAVKEGVKGRAASLSDEVESKEEGIQRAFKPRELVCDAYGKCKHRIASALGKTKDAAAEKAHEAAEKIYEVEEAASEAAGKVKDTVAHTASKAAGAVKDSVSHTANKASDRIQESKENVKDSAKEALSKAKEEVSEKAKDLKDEAAAKMEGAKEVVAEKAKAAKEAAESGMRRANDDARRVRKEGQKELREIIQHAREVAGDVSDYVAPPGRVALVAGILHLMGFSAAYGMCVWITFASSYVLARALPRQQFAMVQSKIYPVYFKAMACSVGLALLGLLMGPSRRSTPPSVVVFQGLNLASALAMIFTNLLWLEPRATKVMMERMKKEKEEGVGKEGHATEPSLRAVDSTADTAGRGPTGEAAAVTARAQIVELRQTLQRLNSYSSFLNALTLVSLTWHLVHLGHLLHTAC